MKYLVIIASGLTDLPAAERDNKTALELSDTPNLDRFLREGRAGSFTSIPEGLPTGSDVSFLSLLGYDPKRHRQGAAYYDAAALGVSVGEGEMPLCLDFVNLQSSHNDMVMKDFTAGHLQDKDARRLLSALEEQVVDAPVRFYPGAGHHHLMVIKGPPIEAPLTPPNELIGEGIRQFMPEGDACKELVFILNQSQIILHNHPYNRERKARGEDPVNSIWLWGNGPRGKLPSFRDTHKLSGSVITASVLFKGMARSAGMNVVEVEGATGFADTNYRGKVAAVLDELERADAVFVHAGAAEEISLKGNLDDKVLAIEDIDSELIGPLVAHAKEQGDVSTLIAVNHFASVVQMKYSRDPVPYVVSPAGSGSGQEKFSERMMTSTDNRFPDGPALMEAFFNGRIQ